MCHKCHFLSVNGSSNRDIPYTEDMGSMEEMMEKDSRRENRTEKRREDRSIAIA